MERVSRWRERWEDLRADGAGSESRRRESDDIVDSRCMCELAGGINREEQRLGGNLFKDIVDLFFGPLLFGGWF